MFLQNVGYSNIFIVPDIETYIHIYMRDMYTYVSENALRKRHTALISSNLGNASSTCI